MKTAGIIAEYNPFHNGHAYHLNEVRKQTGADYLVVVMSGNFMQRGVPAMAGKYERAAMALLNGADLVLELPCLFACSSAEYFAMGAVSILHQIGIIDTLGFGCENNNLNMLQKIADLLLLEPEDYRLLLQEQLKCGCSFPVARSIALKKCLGDEFQEQLFSSPNNILGIEYLKALKSFSSSIKPLAIRREGSAYQDDKLHSSYSSALAIRKALFNNNPPDFNLNNIEGHVPSSVLSIIKEHYHKTLPITTDDFSSQLHYKLLLEAETGYTEYLDISKDLSDKIKKNLQKYQNFDSFCMLLKSKEMTYTRICRCLTHILLNIRQDALTKQVPYARILGLKPDSSPLLKALKENSQIPLISVAAEAKDFLRNEAIPEKSKQMLQLDIAASRIYNSAVYNKYHTILPDEFASTLLKV